MKQWWLDFQGPIGSRYVYVCHIYLHVVDVYVMVNVGDYTIHGSYGYILSDIHTFMRELTLVQGNALVKYFNASTITDGCFLKWCYPPNTQK